MLHIAFAELQTDIGEMTNDLSHSGVPYNDYQISFMKILSPNANDEEKYMILHQIEIPVNEFIFKIRLINKFISSRLNPVDERVFVKVFNYYLNRCIIVIFFC